MQKIKSLVKNSTILGWFFLILMLFMIKIMQLVVRPNPKSIMFMSYGGRQISDSPSEVYLRLLRQNEFNDWNLRWALNEPKLFTQIDDAHKVSSNSPLFFYHLLRSKYWVTNSSIDRLVPFKHPRNVYIQFWHGMPMKTLGSDEEELASVVKWWYNHVEFDYQFVYGDFDRAKMEHVFKSSKRIIPDGLMRKNIIKRRAKVGTAKLRKEIGISGDKPVLLYVPSFRGYHTEFNPFLSSEALAALSSKYTIIYRGHYYEDDSNVEIKSFADKSLYKLMLISDVMVTDYSSVVFDYLPLQRPIYLIQQDIDEYIKRRGLYLTGEDLQLPVAHSEKELIALLFNNEFDQHVLKQLLERFNPAEENSAWLDIYEILHQENI